MSIFRKILRKAGKDGVKLAIGFKSGNFQRNLSILSVDASGVTANVANGLGEEKYCFSEESIEYVKVPIEFEIP